MPQMMPMNWMSMFLILNTLIIITITNTFFITKYNTTPHQQPKIKTPLQTWAW